MLVCLLADEKYPLTIYGKLQVKSFTFLYDLSNKSQNITKKRYAILYDISNIYDYLIVVSCKIKKADIL